MGTCESSEPQSLQESDVQQQSLLARHACESEGYDHAASASRHQNPLDCGADCHSKCQKRFEVEFEQEPIQDNENMPVMYEYTYELDPFEKEGDPNRPEIAGEDNEMIDVHQGTRAQALHDRDASCAVVEEQLKFRLQTFNALHSLDGNTEQPVLIFPRMDPQEAEIALRSVLATAQSKGMLTPLMQMASAALQRSSEFPASCQRQPHVLPRRPNAAYHRAPAAIACSRVANPSKNHETIWEDRNHEGKVASEFQRVFYGNHGSNPIAGPERSAGDLCEPLQVEGPFHVECNDESLSIVEFGEALPRRYLDEATVQTEDYMLDCCTRPKVPDRVCRDLGESVPDTPLPSRSEFLSGY